MGLPKLKFSIRTVLIVVAVLALGLGGYDGWRRSVVYQRHASYHADRLRVVEWLTEELAACDEADSMRFGYSGGDRDRFWQFSADTELGMPAAEFRAVLGRLRSHHEGLARRYRRASYFPWISVPPDPPEPEMRW